MNKLNIFTALFIGTLILFSTCKKDSNPVICKITQMKMVAANSTDTGFINYTYDSNDRLIKVDLGGGFYTNYSYSGTTLTETNYNNDALSGTNVYSLNSSGYADIAINKDANSQVVSNTVYSYDDNGYLITKTVTKTADNTDVTTTTYNYDDNGNMTSSATEHDIASTGNTYNWENDYDYYTDKPNKNSTAKKFEGKLNSNLVKSNTYYFNGDLSLTTNYAYEMNSDGYFTKRTVVAGGSITYDIPEYSCK